jgi:Mn-dependent DtxR family transcriptional regulator
MKKLAKFKLCGMMNTTISGKLLYLVLDELANEDGEVVIPQKKISDALHISKRTVSRNLLRLRDGGYISIQAQYRSDDGGRSANKYSVK